ncbi:hypothetical protein ACP70R_036230 [Stipagrostis hirtigluma subsp. patula]
MQAKIDKPAAMSYLSPLPMPAGQYRRRMATSDHHGHNSGVAEKPGDGGAAAQGHKDSLEEVSQEPPPAAGAPPQEAATKVDAGGDATKNGHQAP